MKMVLLKEDNRLLQELIAANHQATQAINALIEAEKKETIDDSVTEVKQLQLLAKDQKLVHDLKKTIETLQNAPMKPAKKEEYLPLLLSVFGKKITNLII